MDSRRKQELDELIYLALENGASESQIKVLDDLIESDPEIKQYVFEYYSVVTTLRKFKAFRDFPD